MLPHDFFWRKNDDPIIFSTNQQKLMLPRDFFHQKKLILRMIFSTRKN